MPTTIEVNTGADSTPTEYVEDGFVLSTGQPHSQSGQTPDGLTIATDGGSTYLVTTYSNSEVFLESASGSAFGLLSIDLDGFINSDAGGGIVRGTPAPVTFTFTGFNPNLLMPLVFSYTTDDLAGFETVVLPAEFASGLIQVSWIATDGTNVWGGFDNLLLQTNTAPVATGLTGSTSVQTDGTITGQLGATDADNDPLSYQLINPVDGVSIDSNGQFFVERTEADDNLLPGQTRQVSFQYAVSDGAEVSDPQTITVTFAAPPKGADIHGTKKSDTLNGTSKSESIYGHDGHDKLNGMGGADKLYGGDGKDTISGGAGHDQLWGQDHKDRLEGGAGNDTLSGGDDNDTFVFGVGFGDDILIDFRSGRWDCKDGRGHDRDHDRDDDRGGHRGGSRDDDDRGGHHGGSWGDHGHDSHHHGRHCDWDGADVIQFNPSVFGSFDDVMAHATQTWYGTVITADDGSSLTLLGVLKTSLDAEDFLFA